VGAPCRAERVSKFNRLVEIERRLSTDNRLQADSKPHVFVTLNIPPPQTDEDAAITQAPSPLPDKPTGTKLK